MASVSEHTFKLLVDGSAGLASARAFRQAWEQEMGALGRTGKAMSAEQQFTAIRGGATVVSNALLAVGVAGAAIGGASLKMASDFDSAMRNVNAVAQLSESQFQSLKNEVLDFSLTTRASSTDVAGALYNVVSAGLSLEKSVSVPLVKVRELADGSKELYTETLNLSEGMAVMQMASRAAGAGLATTEDTSRLLIAALRSYGLDVSEAGRVTDLFLYTVNRGITTLPELAGELGSVFPSAKAAGLSLEDLTASVALLTQKGLNTAEATTALNQAIVSIIDPGDALTEVFRKAGYESGVAALQGLGWAGVMRLISRETGGAADEIVDLFGNIRAQRAVFNLATDDARELSAMVKDFGENAAGAVELARAEQYKSLAANLEKVKSAFEVIAITVGETFLPSLSEGLSDLATRVRDVGASFRELPQGEQQRWVGIAAGVSGAALSLGVLTKIAIGTADAYFKLAKAIEAANAAQAAGGLGGGVVGAAKLAGGIGAAGAIAFGGAALAKTGLEAALPSLKSADQAMADTRDRAGELATKLQEVAARGGDASKEARQLQQELNIAGAQVELGGMSWEQYGQRITEIQGRIDKLTGATGDTATEAERLASTDYGDMASQLGRIDRVEGSMLTKATALWEEHNQKIADAISWTKQAQAAQAELGDEYLTSADKLEEYMNSLASLSMYGFATPGMTTEFGPQANTAFLDQLALERARRRRIEREQESKDAEKAAEDWQRANEQAVNELRSTIEGVLKPTLDQVWQPPEGTVPRIDEAARRLATVATSGFGSEWLDQLNTQFAGMSFWQPIADAMSKGDEGALKAAATQLLSGPAVSQLWDINVIKQKVRDEMARQNAQEQIINTVMQELSAEGLKVGAGQIQMAMGVSPVMNMLMGDPTQLGPQLQSTLSAAMSATTIDPAVFSGSPVGRQVAGAMAISIRDGLGGVQWSMMLAEVIQADFNANLEGTLKPMVIPVGQQLGDWLAEGAAESSFSQMIIAAVMEQMAAALEG